MVESKDNYKVKLLKLVSGEEIVANVMNEPQFNTKYIVKEPCILVPTGKNSLGVMPWMPYLNHTNPLLISKDKVVLAHKPTPELEEQYKKTVQIINSPIVQPKEKKLILPN